MTTHSTLESRIATLVAQVAKLAEADTRQRLLIVAVRRYLAAGVCDPLRMAWILSEIETVLESPRADGEGVERA